LSKNKEHKVIHSEQAVIDSSNAKEVLIATNRNMTRFSSFQRQICEIIVKVSSSEHHKGFSNIAYDVLFLNSNHIELDCLCKWSALTDSYNITNSGSSEGWGQVSWQIVMSLLKSVIFLDVVQVISSQDHGSVHFIG